MTLLSQILVEAEEQLLHVHNVARELVSRLLLPKTLTRSILQKYIRKAIQNRSWFKLSQLQRALIYTASKIVEKVKSPILRQLLEEILLTIELATTKGQALYYGTILLTKQAPHLIKQLLTQTKQLLAKILFLGINYLNNPPIYRLYG